MQEGRKVKNLELLRIVLSFFWSGGSRAENEMGVKVVDWPVEKIVCVERISARVIKVNAIISDVVRGDQQLRRRSFMSSWTKIRQVRCWLEETLVARDVGGF